MSSLCLNNSRSTSASSSKSNPSRRRLFKNKIEPEDCMSLISSSVLIPLQNGRTIRVLQTFSNAEAEQKSSLHSIRSADEKIVIFFTHGVGGSAELWRAQILFFHSKGYDIVAPDLLGHGLSSKPSNSDAYSFDNLSQDMLQVFDKYCRKRNILVGHSYGASFVTMVAAERAHLVSKVVLISGGPPSPLQPEKFSLFRLPLLIFVPLKPMIIRKFRSMAFHCKKKEEITFSVSAFVLKSVMKGQKWSEGNEEYHANLMVPVLLIFGAQDKFVTLEEEKWMEETIYGCQLDIVEEAGHMVMMEQPDVVNQMILRFLNRDSTTKSSVQLLGATQSSNQSGSSDQQSLENQSNHVINAFVHKELLHGELSRPPSRAPSRMSRKGSEKRTKFVL
eukprot:gene9536-10523_t